MKLVTCTLHCRVVVTLTILDIPLEFWRTQSGVRIHLKRRGGGFRYFSLIIICKKNGFTDINFYYHTKSVAENIVLSILLLLRISEFPFVKTYFYDFVKNKINASFYWKLNVSFKKFIKQNICNMFWIEKHDSCEFQNNIEAWHSHFLSAISWGGNLPNHDSRKSFLRSPMMATLVWPGPTSRVLIENGIHIVYTIFLWDWPKVLVQRE